MKHLPVFSTAALATAALLLFIPGVSRADTVTDVAISYGGGTVIPSGSWNDALGGPTIVAAPKNGDQGTGITFADWSGQFNEIDAGSDRTFSLGGVTLTANSQVNTLINTFFGDNGLDGTLTFTNSLNQTAMYLLYGDQTVRDYNQAFYANDLTGFNALPGGGAVTAQNWWNNAGSQRLDVQTFVLPSSWDGTTLTSLNIAVSQTAYADDAFSAIQVVNRTPTNPSPVPEPSSLVLLGSGLTGLVGVMRRRRRSS